MFIPFIRGPCPSVASRHTSGPMGHNRGNQTAQEGITELRAAQDRRQEEVDKSMASIREVRKPAGRITLSELLSTRDEGRKARWLRGPEYSGGERTPATNH